MWLLDLSYYLLLAFIVVWIAKALISCGFRIFLGLFSFSRYRVNIDKFLECPIAHRCGTPENSLAGIKWCKQRGAVAVEMDLNLTKDNVPVLFHDNLSHVTFEEVKVMTKGTICTLHEALGVCKELNLRVFLDVKTLLCVSKVTGVIKKLYLEDYSLYDRMIVCCFSPLLITMVRMTDKNIPVAITHRSFALTLDLQGKQRTYKQPLLNLIVPYLDKFILWSIHTWYVELFGISLMLVHKDDISRKYIESWKRKNIMILAWTVNDKHEQMYCDKTLKISYMTDWPES